MRNSSKRDSSSALLMRAAHCISRRRRIRSMSFSSKQCTRLRPRLLGGAAGGVRRRQHRGHVLVLGGDRHDADRAAEPEAAVFPGVAEVADRLAQRLGRAQRLLQRAALEQHAELVAAEARERVAPAHLRLQQRADLAEQRVARAVAAGVVDDLELVEVDVAERVGGLARLRALQRALEPRLELAPVDEPGQHVVARVVGEPPVQLARLATRRGTRARRRSPCRCRRGSARPCSRCRARCRPCGSAASAAPT